VPFLVRDVLGVRPDVADPGVVDDDVEAPEVAHDGREGVVDLLPVRDARRVRSRLDARAAELLRRHLRRARVHLEHRDRDSPVERAHHAILASLARLVKMTIVDSRC